MAIVERVKENKITQGAKGHLVGSGKLYCDRSVRTAQLSNQEVSSEREFHRKSFAMDQGNIENHIVRYVRKGNRIVIVHLDRE